MGRAGSAPPPRVNHGRIAGFQRIRLALVEEFLIAGFFDHGDLSGLAFFAAVHSPRRIFHPIEHGLEVAVAEDLVSLAIAKAAAKSAGAAGIFTQPELDDLIG